MHGGSSDIRRGSIGAAHRDSGGGPRGASLRAAVVVFALVLLATPLLAQSSDDDVRGALERVRDESIQWELPEGRPEESLRLPIGLGLPLLEILLVAVGLAIVIGAALLISSYVRNRAPVERADDPEFEDEAPRVALSGRPLEAATSAARAGRYEEAVHLLLLGTIEEIRAALRYDVHPSWTSREIARRAPLPEDGRAPLGDLVSAVERSYFGGLGVTASDYEQCVSRHEDLRRACEGSAS